MNTRSTAAASTSALQRVTRCTDFRRLATPGASGSRSERASGNGSIMRLAPVPIRFASLFPNDIPELARLSGESSLPTHASEQCLSACRYLSLVLCGLMHGIDREEVLAADWEPLTQLNQLSPLEPAIGKMAAGSFREKQPARNSRIGMGR